MTATDPVKVIRVGGTSYSGSTMLDLMLANDEKGFSCGEIVALFRPYRAHHFSPICGCGDPGCRIWESARAAGEKNLWPHMAANRPDAAFYVDSSKDPLWFYDQRAASGQESVHVMIWKTPEEFAYSCYKRGVLGHWRRSYVNYFRRYFQVVEDFHAVRYAELVRDPAAQLERLCRAVGIEYFPGKEQYWQRTHHTLFGSDSAKLHLHAEQSDAYRHILDERGARKPLAQVDAEPEVSKHKSIYYDERQINALPAEVRRGVEADSLVQAIAAVLEAATEASGAGAAELAKIQRSLGWRAGWVLGRRTRDLMRRARARRAAR